MSELRIIPIPATVHGRMLVRPASAPSAPLLAAFHGYGENADSMLEAVLEIPGISDWHVVAIQGLHPFYERRNNEVVASWMTSQDREHAIADNVAYVSQAIEQARSQLETETGLVYVGFSQGTAMAYRAAALGAHPCVAVIALGGDVPAEVENADTHPIPRVLIGRGGDDAWYTHEKLEADLVRLKSIGSTVEICRYNGGHVWTDDFRAAAGRFLRSL